MVYHSRKIFSQEVEPIAVAKHWVHKNVEMLKHTMQVHQNNPTIKVIDLYYVMPAMYVIQQSHDYLYGV